MKSHKINRPLLKKSIYQSWVLFSSFFYSSFASAGVFTAASAKFQAFALDAYIELVLIGLVFVAFALGFPQARGKIFGTLGGFFLAGVILYNLNDWADLMKG